MLISELFGYIYLRNHLSYDIYNLYKLGRAINIPERDTQYATGEIIRGYFVAVYKIYVNPIKLKFIEKLLHNEFYDLNKIYNAGTEFYDKKIIDLIEPVFNKYGFKYKKLSENEIKNLTRCNRVKYIFKKININSFINTLKYKNKKNKDEFKINEKYIWNERLYQTNIISFSKNELLKKNKLYIELPTGSGKSFIVYNLLNFLQSEFIIIISPRIIVNEQNISNKYLQLLNDKYKVFNYSNDNNLNKFLKSNDKKIIICCTQSINKIYESIKLINNITIWFDESHWGIEDSIDKLNNNSINNNNLKFWLLNNTNIKYRIFTSASPDKNIILENEQIFGKLYSPLTIRELINDKWLSDIDPYVFCKKINIINVNIINYIIDTFIDKKCNYGFSYHNKQKNAFNLFYKHYLIYKNNKTNIKPFLLIGNDFNDDKDNRLNKINLDYEYRNIKEFENNIQSIGYVVAKYSLGYDFNKLDYISISDPKLSIQDIKQSIGRGIRSDGLNENGSNKNKILKIILPTYIDINIDKNNKYYNILQVLKYLLNDIEIPIEKINFINGEDNNHVNNCSKNNNSNDYNDYNGIDEIKAKLLDLLELENKKTIFTLTYDKAKKIIKEKNIKTKKDYYELCEKDNRFSKEPDIIFKNTFNWIDYLNIQNIYYDFETCKNKIKFYFEKKPEIKNSLNLLFSVECLCEIDKSFPPSDLWVEYYQRENHNIKDLSDIIITNKIFKKILL